MPVIIAEDNALRIIRAGAVTPEVLSPCQCQRLIARTYPKEGEVRRLVKVFSRETGHDEPGVSPNAQPLALAMSAHRGRVPVRGARFRYLDAPLPAGSLLHVTPDVGLGSDVYATSVALSYTLMARTRGFGSLVVLGMELCGTYERAPWPMGGCKYNVRPAMRPHELQQSLTALKRAAGGRRVFGLTRALAAAPFVLGQSGSPMESKVATVLTAPASRGGWGLKGLELNARVELDEAQRAIAQLPYLKIDGRLAHTTLGYEYDSREYHDREQRDYADRDRLAAAQMIGFTLVPLTTEVVRDEERFEAFCREFLRVAGKRVREPGKRTREARHRLLREVGLRTGPRERRYGFAPDQGPQGAFWDEEPVPLEAYGA